MGEQFELFNNNPKKPKNKKARREKHNFDVVIEGLGIGMVRKTEKERECFICHLPIPAGSKAEKQTPVVDERPLWHYTRYRHLPKCPPPEDEPV